MFLPSLLNLTLLAVAHNKIPYKVIVPSIIENDIEKLESLMEKKSAFCFGLELKRPVSIAPSPFAYGCPHEMIENVYGKLKRMKVSAQRYYNCDECLDDSDEECAEINPHVQTDVDRALFHTNSVHMLSKKYAEEGLQVLYLFFRKFNFLNKMGGFAFSGLLKNVDLEMMYKFKIFRHYADTPDIDVSLKGLQLAYKTVLYCFIRGDFNWDVLCKGQRVTFNYGEHVVIIKAKRYNGHVTHKCNWSSTCCKCNFD